MAPLLVLEQRGRGVYILKRKKLNPFSVEAYNNAGMLRKMKMEMLDTWDNLSFEEKVNRLERPYKEMTDTEKAAYRRSILEETND